MTEFLQEQGIRIPRRALADQPRLSHVVDLMKEVDIPMESMSDLANSWKVVKQRVMGETFAKGFKQVAEQGAIGTVATLGGGAGKVFALGMEMGDILRTLTHKSSAFGKKNPTRGQWLAINNGVALIAKKAKELKKLLSDKAQEKKGKKLPELRNAKTVSIGFMVEVGQDLNSVVVFNFRTKRKEQRLVSETLVLGPPQQERLDKNVILLQIKKIVLGEQVNSLRSQLDTGVNVDPGSEVVYKGKLYKVLDCDGFSAKIEGGNRILEVDVSLLSNGRVKHSNSNNYAKNTESWDQGRAPKLYNGMWVWLTPRASTIKRFGNARYELGVLRLLNAAIADGYYALDGMRFQTHVKTIRGCPQNDQEWMNSHSDFQYFKAAATKGVGVGRLKLGRDHLSLVLGIKKVGEGKLPPPLKFTKLPIHLEKLGKILETGERNVQSRPNTDKAEHDAAREIQLENNMSTPGAQHMVDQAKSKISYSDPIRSVGSNAGMAFIGVGVAVAVWFLTG